MSNIWVLFKNNIKISVFKKPLSYLLSLAAPIVILVVAANILGSSSSYVKVGVIDEDNSRTSTVIINALKAGGDVDIIDVENQDMNSLFMNQTVSSVIQIPKAYEEGMVSGNDVKISIKSSEESSAGSLPEAVLENEIMNIKNIGRACKGNKESYYEALSSYDSSELGKVEKKKLSDLNNQYTVGQIFVGFMILFMLQRGMSNAGHVFDEKFENVYNRIFMCPVTAVQYYIADALSSYVMILTQIVLSLIGLSALNYNMGVPVLPLFIVLNVIGIVSVALAILVRAFAKNMNEASNIFQYMLITLVMIGGCFVPIEVMPDIFQKISYFTPVRWATQCIVDMQSGLPFLSTMKYIAIMMMFAIVFFLAAAYKTSKEDKKFSI